MAHGPDFYRDVLEHLYDGVYFVGRDRKITYWNRGAERLTGYTREDAVGAHCWDRMLDHVDDQGRTQCQEGCPIGLTLQDGRDRQAELFLRHKEGHRLPVAVRSTPMYDAKGQIVGAVEIFREKAASLAARRRISELGDAALTDPLTRLPNRRYLQTELAAQLDGAARYGWKLGVLCLDVDACGRINEAHGRDVGDRVLRMVGLTLLSNARTSDLIGRWEGDEFVAILPNVDERLLTAVADRFRSLIGRSGFSEGKDLVRASVSVGGALARPDDAMELLLERARQHLREARQSAERSRA